MSVILYYGPYEAHGIIRHKTHRLKGLIERLTKLRYFVELVASPHLNRLTVEMRGHPIFTCDIRNLLFNLSLEMDAVGQRIIDVIRLNETIYYADDNMAKFDNISKGMRWLNYKHNVQNVQDYLDSDVSLLYKLGVPHQKIVLDDPRFMSLFLQELGGEEVDHKPKSEDTKFNPYALVSSMSHLITIRSVVIDRSQLVKQEYDISYISAEPSMDTECLDGPCPKCPPPEVLEMSPYVSGTPSEDIETPPEATSSPLEVHFLDND